MKKGFFLLAAMSAIFNNRNVGGKSLNDENRILENCNPISKGYAGSPSKHNWETMHKKRKHRNRLNRIAKQSRNINHKKAA